MEYQDRVLVCRDCGNEFVFSVGEQEFFAEKGFQNDPSRCPACRSARRKRLGSEREPRELYPTTCSQCGVETQVPFLPSNNRPVYCNECYKSMRGY